MRNKILVVAALVAITPMVLKSQEQLPLNPKLHSFFPARPSDYLTDLAGIVKNPQAVNDRLRAIRENNKLSVVVVTLSTIDDYAIEDVAREIGRRWQVATANDTIGAVVRNTGGVILLVTNIRSCRIEVATGSEGYMTDLRSANACRDAAADFRSGNFGDGFISIANTFVRHHRQELARAAEIQRPKPPAKPFPWGAFFIYLLAIGIPIGVLTFFFGRRAYLKAVARRAEEERLEAERQRLAAIRQREAEEAERHRWNSLTPEQQQEELAEKARLAAIAEEQRRQEEEIRRHQQRENEKRVARQRRDSSSGNSSKTGSSSSWRSGGSSSFRGGGGGSSY